MLTYIEWLYLGLEIHSTLGWYGLASPELLGLACSSPVWFGLSWYGLVRSALFRCSAKSTPALNWLTARASGIVGCGQTEIKKPSPYMRREIVVKHHWVMSHKICWKGKVIRWNFSLLRNSWNVSPPVSISVLLIIFPTWYLDPLPACSKGVSLHCAKMRII